MICRCRNCGDRYDSDKTRAEIAGYCTQACVHEKARRHGFRKCPRRWQSRTQHEYPSEYEVLNRAKLVGHVQIPVEDL